jgi:hypothetical protein
VPINRGRTSPPAPASAAQAPSITRLGNRSASQPIGGCRTTLPTISTPSAVAADDAERPLFSP